MKNELQTDWLLTNIMPDKYVCSGQWTPDYTYIVEHLVCHSAIYAMLSALFCRLCEWCFCRVTIDAMIIYYRYTNMLQTWMRNMYLAFAFHLDGWVRRLVFLSPLLSSAPSLFFSYLDGSLVWTKTGTFGVFIWATTSVVSCGGHKLRIAFQMQVCLDWMLLMMNSRQQGTRSKYVMCLI